MKHQTKEQWFLLPILLIPFLQKLMCIYCCNSYQDKTNENQVKEILNFFIQSKFEKTKNPIWLKFIYTIAHPSHSAPFEACLLAITLSLSGCSSLALLPSSLALDNPKGVLSVLALCLLGYILGLHYHQNIEHPFWSIAGIIGIYSIICLLYTIKKMRTTKKKKISLDQIAQLLNRKEITIY